MKLTTIHRKAKDVLDNGKVTARLDDLRAQLASEQKITRGEIAVALRTAATGAEAAGQWSALVQAALGLAKLSGLLVEKRQVRLDDGAAHLAAVRELAARGSMPDLGKVSE